MSDPYGIWSGNRLLGFMMALHKESEACVRVEGALTEEIVVDQGLRWGASYPHKYFNIFLDRC